MIWVLVGYMWLFIHRPFEVWPWLGDLHIERVYMFCAIAYWAFVADKSWTSNRVNIAVGLMAVAIVFCTLLSRLTDFDNETVQNWCKLLVFYVLLISSVRTEQELKILVVAFVGVMGLYQLHSLREYLNGRGFFAMGTWRMVGVDGAMNDPNTFAASVNYGLPMLWPVFALAKRPWQKLAIVGLFGLGCLCILLTGSRTGFAGMALLLLGAGVASRYRWRLLAMVVVALPITWLSLSENLQNRYMTLIDPSVGPANAQESADTRNEFFWIAVRIWKENPVFGVGPGGFLVASGTGHEAHTLYGQTISELGAVGAMALLAMVLATALNVRDAKRFALVADDDPETIFLRRVALATGITLAQLLFFGFGGHNLFRYTWLWYGAFGALSLQFLLRRGECANFATLEDELSDVFTARGTCQAFST